MLILGPFSRDIANLENFAKSMMISNFDSLVVVTQSSDKFQKLSEIADIRLKVIELEGSLLSSPRIPGLACMELKMKKTAK